MKNKILLFLSIILLAAGCNIFSAPVPSGVVKTVNGGADWQFSNGAKAAKINLSSSNISKIALSPANHEVVYAGSFDGGVYESDDSGANWKQILSKILVYDLAVDPHNPKQIYAAGMYSNLGKVLKTTDGGLSWQEIYNESTQNNPVRAIAVNPLNPSQIVIGSSSGNLIKSADGGMSWQLAQNFNDRAQEITWQNGSLYVLFRSKGLFKSSDFGLNFEDLTAGLTVSKVIDYIGGGGNEKSFNHFFVDSLTSSLIYITSNKGLYKTVDNGKTWASLALPVKISDAQVMAVKLGNSSNLVFVSVGATIYKSTDAGSSWQTQGISTNGYVNCILVDPGLPQIIYAGIYVNKQ